MGTPPEPPAVWVDPAHFAAEAERIGFESVWLGEHVTSPVHCESYSPTFEGGQVPGFFDPLVGLARASAATQRIRLGTGVLLPPEHHPVRLAKAVASLDHLSGGRLLLGVGVGWNREERAIMGGDPHRPWRQTAEAVEVMTALWTRERTAFEGQFYRFPEVRCFPPPRQQPRPPILISGVADRLVERMVAWADGWLAFRTTPAELEVRLAELARRATAAGRDPAAFDISMYTWEPSADLARRYADAGAGRLIVQTPGLATEAETTAALERIAELVGL
jgi:probable F420-dependent oxidoreductase